MEIEESMALFTAKVKPMTGSEVVPLIAALGRIVADNIYAPIAVPSFARSAMDGYAVNAQDTVGATQVHPIRLKVLGTIYAGDNMSYAYKPNTCVRIMTGAPIPAGFNAIIKQEHTDYGEDFCHIYKRVVAFENYCHVGEDVAAAQSVLTKGTMLQPIHLGLLAGCGIATVIVKRKLRAAILCTGSELCEPDEALTYGKIYNSIGYLLQGVLDKQGMEVIAKEIIQDDKAALESKLLSLAEQADIVITTGGVSVGERDLLPKVLADLKAENIFDKADIQPGAATQGWLLEEKPILCLSGNPYAAYANFELYFWELAAKLYDSDYFKVHIEKAVLKNDVTKIIKHRRLLRAYATAGYVAVADSSHAASVINDLTVCNCFVDARPTDTLRAGQTVTIRLFKL